MDAPGVDDGPKAQGVFTLMYDTRFHLFLSRQTDIALREAQAFAEARRELISRHIPATSTANAAEWVRAGVDTPIALLVRPDGHVGYRAERFDRSRLQHYRVAHLHLQPVSAATD